MSLYHNKYRVESIRLKGWDYTSPWWYYVTINTKNHIQYFGKIKDGKMIINSTGEIVLKEWENTKTIRKNVDLDYFVIMPNHIHGIIIINESIETTDSLNSKKNVEMTRWVISDGEKKNEDDKKKNDNDETKNYNDEANNDNNEKENDNNETKNETMQRIVSTTLKSNSLGSIIGQIKSVCAKQIHANGNKNFAWQKGFYERIIRNEKELYNIRKYIIENPVRWELEKNKPKNMDI